MRHRGLKVLVLLILGIALFASMAAGPRHSWAADVPTSAATAKRPNILLIITDDQGWGDLGCHGNAKIHTPRIDRLAAQSTELSRLYVCPVCAPTRASLLTGRYNYRTGVVDTYIGRAMMRPDEVTLAEMLSRAGYRTGIFGKWHLGDNYPLRAKDQGFEDSLVLFGGGLVQPGDPPQGNSYFDPWLRRNGDFTQVRGYCTDIFADEAIRFIKDAGDKPWFVYLPFNAPHVPLEVSEKDLAPYKNAGLSDELARAYAMETVIDTNVGRVLDEVERKGDADNTIVIYMSDNGPAIVGFNGGMRGHKATVYEGGLHVPFFIRWPGKFAAGAKIAEPTAHIDVTPTLLAACGAVPPKGVRMDGVNLLPLLMQQAGALAPRDLFFQWQRTDAPQMGRACAAIRGNMKLVQARGLDGSPLKDGPLWELFNLKDDPGEQHNLAASQAEILADLKAHYEAWFRDVSSGGYEPVRFAIGTRHENPVLLTRQEARGNMATWAGTGLGQWHVSIEPGRYDLRVWVKPENKLRQATLSAGPLKRTFGLPGGSEQLLIEDVELPGGDHTLEVWTTPAPQYAPKGLDAAGRERLKQGVLYVEARRRDT